MIHTATIIQSVMTSQFAINRLMNVKLDFVMKNHNEIVEFMELWLSDIGMSSDNSYCSIS